MRATPCSRWPIAIGTTPPACCCLNCTANCANIWATFYAALPTRDILMAFSSSDDDVLSRIRQEIADDFARTPDGLSPKLFLVTPDGIAGDPADQEDFDL